MIGLGFGFGFDILGSNVNQPEAETLAYIDGLATPLSTDQISRINTLVKSLKTGLSITSLSTFFDTFYVLAGETAESSLKNLVKNAHHCQAINSPAWAQFEGYKGNNVNAYLRTNYNAGTQRVNFQQNSASHGIYVRTTTYDRAFCGFANAATAGSVVLGSSSSIRMLCNSAFNTTIQGSGDLRALYISSRLSSSEYINYKNKVSLGSSVFTSIVPPSFEDYILAYNENGTMQLAGNNQVSMRFTAKGCTQNDVNVINDAFEVYMSAVGKSILLASTPMVAFTFDDGYTEWNTILKTAFDNESVKATFYLATGIVNYLIAIGQWPTHRITDAAITELINAGYDVQCHTSTHTNLLTLSDAQILAEYDAVTDYFTAKGWPIPKHTAYPGGSESANINLQTSYKRLTARLVNAGGFTHTVNKMRINSSSINIAKNDVTALNVVKSVFTTIAANKQMTTLFGHRVYNDADADNFPGNSIQLSYLVDLIADAKAKGIKIVTISELYGYILAFTVTT